MWRWRGVGVGVGEFVWYGGCGGRRCGPVLLPPGTGPQTALAVISEEGVSHRGVARTLRDRVPRIAKEFKKTLQQRAVADLLGKTVQLVEGASVETIELVRLTPCSSPSMSTRASPCRSFATHRYP